MLTGFSAHLCDIVQKQRRWQKPIVTILLSERSNDSIQFNFICIALFTIQDCHKAALQRALA